MGFPRFIFNDSKNPDSIGPVIFHMNFPRAVFSVNYPVTSTKPLIVLIFLIDKASEEKIDKLAEAATLWLEKNQFDNGYKINL